MMKKVIIFCCLAFCGLLSEAKYAMAQVEPMAANWTYAEKKMRSAGLKPDFIRAVKSNYHDEGFQDVVELNILLFLRKANIHQSQAQGEAVTRVRSFMEDHKTALCEAEAKQKVSAPVIASLLWIESRFGENLGHFNIASVFVDLLQTDRPEILKRLRSTSITRFTAKASRKDLKKIASRTRKKVVWAMNELKALQVLYRIQGMSALQIRGSYAGAFGMSQFLPSSYKNLALKVKKGSNKLLDLDKADDAIQSVAAYLHENGWRKRDKTHVKALMNYNNSRDYANAILKLAANASNDREPASMRGLPKTLPAKKTHRLALGN